MIDSKDVSALAAAIAVGCALFVAARALILPVMLGLFTRRP